MHEEFEKNPTLNNYDKLQSELKAEERSARKLDPKSDKVKYLNEGIENSNSDKEAFMKTLPEKMQNLENEFRLKYATGVGKYENAPNVIKKLAAGKWQEVTANEIEKVFTNPTKETLEILKDAGPSIARNILYNALQKVKPGDAEGIAKTILELKRTKGYDRFVTKEIEDHAHKILRQVSITKAIKSGAVV